MLKFIVLSVLHCASLCSGQVLMKLALQKTGRFRMSWEYVKDFLTCWEWAACGASFTAAFILWMHILKRYDFSLAYPVTSLTFVFSVFAAYFVFHEQIPVNRWIGVGLITLGVVFIASR